MLACKAKTYLIYSAFCFQANQALKTLKNVYNIKEIENYFNYVAFRFVKQRVQYFDYILKQSKVLCIFCDEINQIYLFVFKNESSENHKIKPYKSLYKTFGLRIDKHSFLNVAYENQNVCSVFKNLDKFQSSRSYFPFKYSV